MSREKATVFALIAGGFALMETGVWLYNRSLSRRIWKNASRDGEGQRADAQVAG